MNSTPAARTTGGAPGERILRHAAIDRLLHWVMALAALVLLGSAFLPIMGLEFPWVTLHWTAGFVLAAGLAMHILRASLWQSFGAIWIGAADIRDALGIAKWSLRISSEPPAKPGKYSFAQKIIHHLFSLVVLTAVVTGGLMMVRIDTPWWDRDPYWLSDSTWGIVYVLHGFAALCLLTMVMCHVYFALRPEKWFFTRSMLVGWITRDEYRAHHDARRWQVKE